MTLMQYARSTDPEVIAIVDDNATGLHGAAEKAWAWAESKGAEGGRFYGSSFLGVFRVSGLPLKEKPKGWANARHGFRPRLNSPEYAEMEALAWKKQHVPGLPDHFEGPMDRDGRTVWYSPAPFVSGDAAWVLLREMPVKGEFGEQWVEVKASEAHAAREAAEEQAKTEGEAA